MKEALYSIWDNQILKPDEILVMQDGPVSEEMNKILEVFSTRCPVFKRIELKYNVGLATSLKIGVLNCKNEYIVRMDSDDISTPNRLLDQYKVIISDPMIAVVGSQIEEFLNTPGDLKIYRNVPTSYLEIKKLIKLRNPINHPTVMFRKSLILASGSYKSMNNFEDYYLWLRVIKNNYKIINLNTSILHYRIGNGFLERRTGIKYLKDEIRFLKKIKKEKLIPNFNYFISLTLRFFFRLLPNGGIYYFYRLILRSKRLN